MAIKLKSTKDVHLHGLKCLVFGESGVGKTTLMGTLPNAVILSAESGLLSLSGKDVKFFEVKSIEDLQEAYTWVTTDPEGMAFDSICLDSISEIAEVVLNSAKKTNKDPRQAYGEMNETVTDLIRAFRDIPGKNVIFSAKVEKITDEKGRILYGPSMPGKTLAQGLGYFFDLVLALRSEKNEAGENIRMLQTDNDGLWSAKDRSGKLDQFEEPDLGAIIKKIKGGK